MLQPSIAPFMQAEQIDAWGVCPFEAALPLLEVRAKSRLPAQSHSLILMLFGYYVKDYTNRNVSRYTIPDDYHTVIGHTLERLAAALAEAFPGEQFVPFVDASPIAEVRAAALAGLGDIGRNGQLLSPIYGSYCFIGELATTLELPANSCKAKSLCTNCGACFAACPTGALSAAGFDQSRCRSHITQKKGELSNWEREQIKAGGMAWGCDLCTDACPVNRRAQKSRVAAFYENPAPVLTPDAVAVRCAQKAYGWRGERVLLRNLEILQQSDEKNG